VPVLLLPNADKEGGLRLVEAEDAAAITSERYENGEE